VHVLLWEGADRGVETDIGILFVDIRGFTTMAEGEPPEVTAALLNRFYALAADVLSGTTMRSSTNSSATR
jgi:class 3 adenylate cyclase